MLLDMKTHIVRWSFVLVMLGSAPYLNGAPSSTVISSAIADYTFNTLTINGAGFGTSPTVMLGSLQFPVIQKSTSSQIVAALIFPDEISSLAPGSYVLTVTFGNNKTATFDMAVGQFALLNAINQGALSARFLFANNDRSTLLVNPPTPDTFDAVGADAANQIGGAASPGSGVTLQSGKGGDSTIGGPTFEGGQRAYLEITGGDGGDPTNPNGASGGSIILQPGGFGPITGNGVLSSPGAVVIDPNHVSGACIGLTKSQSQCVDAIGFNGLSVNGPICGSNVTCTSSRRYKTNIETMEGALGKVERLRGVSFDWKETGKHDIGLIAEEVRDVVPEVVTYGQNGVVVGLDYARLTAVLIEAVKEQQKQIREIAEGKDEQIRSLKEQLTELQEEMATLRRTIAER